MSGVTSLPGLSTGMAADSVAAIAGATELFRDTISWHGVANASSRCAWSIPLGSRGPWTPTKRRSGCVDDMALRSGSAGDTSIPTYIYT